MAAMFTYAKEKNERKVVEIEIEKLLPNPFQKRKIKDHELISLVESIEMDGIKKPVSVRKVGNMYEIVNGERRVRAAELCGLTSVPCVVREISERTSAILTLAENIERKELNFFEEAEAISRLITQFGMTQEDAASKLGHSQGTIANKLRLLRLSDEERRMILSNGLTERHARTLLRLGSPEERLRMINNIIQNALNVEKTELMIDEYLCKEKIRMNYQKNKALFQNVKVFTNILNKAVEDMQSAGVNTQCSKLSQDKFVEYRVKILFY